MAAFRISSIILRRSRVVCRARRLRVQNTSHNNTPQAARPAAAKMGSGRGLRCVMILSEWQRGAGNIFPSLAMALSASPRASFAPFGLRNGELERKGHTARSLPGRRKATRAGLKGIMNRSAMVCPGLFGRHEPDRERIQEGHLSASSKRYGGHPGRDNPRHVCDRAANRRANAPPALGHGRAGLGERFYNQNG
jgi:hypothetical protein